ncbi:MAG: aminoacyl--tRNA ligase-related protein [Candidatus Hodarchaeales archaeon]|jgi:prolyl-tRNA synthetase
MNEWNDGTIFDKATFLDKFRKSLSDAQIIDYTYPIQGSYILLPYGFQLKTMIFQRFSQCFTDQLQARQVEIPLRIPQDYIMVHSTSTDIKDNPDYLEQIPLKSQGSSDTVQPPFFRGALDLGLYHLLKRTIRSYRDLPQAWFTQGYTMRGDSGIPLARDPEVEFLEGIIAISPEEEQLDMFIELITKAFKATFEELGIPVVPLWKPAFAERFPENKSIKFFTYIPRTKAVISVGIIHFFHDYPTRYFKVQVQNLDQKNVHPWIINFGITERALFAYLVHQMDELGFNLSPASAPVLVSAILRSKASEREQDKESMLKILEKFKEISTILYSPYQPIKRNLILSEAQGAPLRLEAGGREFSANKVTLFKRDSREKETIPTTEIQEKIESELKVIEHLHHEKLLKRKQEMNEWVEKGFVERKILCTDCQNYLEETNRVLGREIGFKDPEGSQNCDACGSPTGVPIFAGGYW